MQEKGDSKMTENYVNFKLINQDGEVVKEKTSKVYNPFKEGVGYNFKYKSTVVKEYTDIQLPNVFTDAEVGRLYKLSKHIYSNSNMLARRIKNKLEPYDKETIRELLGIHRNSFNPFWNKIIKHKIIKSIKIEGKEWLCFNPLYFNTTKYLPLHLFIAFQDELKEHLPEWVISKYLDMCERT